MFDISWGEMLVVGVVALVVIGPKELPGVIRAVGRGASKLRGMANDFRGQFDEAMREAEMHEVKKTFDDVKATATGLATSTFDPIRNTLNEAVETAKGSAAEATGLNVASETIASIEADAKALEADLNAANAAQAPASDVAQAVAEPQAAADSSPKTSAKSA